MSSKQLYFHILFISVLLLSYSCKKSCKDLDCQNGAECIDGNCICAPDYIGKNCEVNIWEAYPGLFTGTALMYPYESIHVDTFKDANIELSLIQSQAPYLKWFLNDSQGINFKMKNNYDLIIPTQFLDVSGDTLEVELTEYSGFGRFSNSGTYVEFDLTFIWDETDTARLVYSGIK